MASKASLRRYRKEGDDFLSIVKTDETFVFHYDFWNSCEMKDPGLICCCLRTGNFRNNEKVKTAKSNWLPSPPAEFYAKEINKLILK